MSVLMGSLFDGDMKEGDEEVETVFFSLFSPCIFGWERI
jgi:hypothetical protein